MSEPGKAGGDGGTEVAEQVQIGTRLRDRAEGRPGAGQPPPALPRGADGTLLAVVPIPGTRTSMAIVGYPVTAPDGTPGRPGVSGAPEAPDVRSGLLLDHDQRRVWVDGNEVTLTFQEFGRASCRERV